MEDFTRNVCCAKQRPYKDMHTETPDFPCRKILLGMSAVQQQRHYKDMNTETPDCPEDFTRHVCCTKTLQRYEHRNPCAGRFYSRCLLYRSKDLTKIRIQKPPIARAGRVYLCRSKTLQRYAYRNPRLPVQEEFTCAEARHYKDTHTETPDCPCRKSLLVQKQDLTKICIQKPPITRAGRVYLC